MTLDLEQKKGCQNRVLSLARTTPQRQQQPSTDSATADANMASAASTTAVRQSERMKKRKVLADLLYSDGPNKRVENQMQDSEDGADNNAGGNSASGGSNAVPTIAVHKFPLF